MSRWAKPNDWIEDTIELDIVEESALARAQSTIQNAINRSGISRSEMARRMRRNRSFVSRMLAGEHNLTVKTMARSMAVCGFEIRFQPVALECNWANFASPPPRAREEQSEAANAASSVLNNNVSTEKAALGL